MPMMSDTRKRDLIEMVKERPALWDKHRPDYRDKGQKKQAWDEIVQILSEKDGYDTDVITLMKKWYNIRDAYVKTKRQGRSYLFAEDLEFLDKILDVSVIMPKRMKRESQYFHTDDQDQSDDLNFFEQDNQESSIRAEFVEARSDDDEYETVDPYNTEFNETQLERQHQRTRAPENTSVVNMLSKILEKEDDEDFSFYKSTLSLVKSLPQEGKLEFRTEVLNLLKVLMDKYRDTKNL